MHCNALQCNAMQRNAMQCNAMQRSAMQCDAMQSIYALQCNAWQYNAIQCNSATHTITRGRGRAVSPCWFGHFLPIVEGQCFTSECALRMFRHRVPVWVTRPIGEGATLRNPIYRNAIHMSIYMYISGACQAHAHSVFLCISPCANTNSKSSKCVYHHHHHRIGA